MFRLSTACIRERDSLHKISIAAFEVLTAVVRKSSAF
jgi:hypothetical protein